jgi:hypothetical protein
MRVAVADAGRRGRCGSPWPMRVMALQPAEAKSPPVVLMDGLLRCLRAAGYPRTKLVRRVPWRGGAAWPPCATG